MKKLIPVILSALLLSSCGSVPPQNEDKAALNPADGMTIEEKVGQLFMARCDSEGMEKILEKQPGGIVMFAVDFENLTEKEVKKKIQSYKDACGIEPIIAVDEEGGTVVRISSNPELAPEKYQSPQYYYNEGGIDAIVKNTLDKSELLKKLGITMNLAPVADVSTDPEDFIYKRSLGQNAEITAEYTAAVTSAAAKTGLMSCLKHFPGYGNNVDTHTGIAIDNRSLDSLRACDFLPFESGIATGAAAVLVSHNIITEADPDEPASISPRIHEILRDELGFDGIIMTDDMSMGAMAEYETPYTRAVLAGNDMIIATDFETAFAEVLGAVKSGEISEETLDKAVNRILRIKSEYGL
ncbi:MAG: glycoside hydrolase family 3 protein [Candidatus Ornithomonoglobus sp.]